MTENSPTHLTVPADAGPGRLDVFLASATGQTRSFVGRLLKNGSVSVNNQPERASYAVQPGDEIDLELPKAPLPSAAPVLTVIYEDADLLVVDKPAGLTVHPARLGGSSTVADFARQRTTDPDPERPGIVHRLDRDTSGLLVIAKTTAAKAVLQQQFRKRTVHKTYRALAIGTLKPPAAAIDLPLSRDPARPLRRLVTSTGKPAITTYRTLETYPGYSQIEVKPQTGRTHQIRVHLAALGHPVAGDIVYGPKTRPLGLKRQFLHAAELEFTAPNGKQLHLVSQLPSDLATVLARLQNQV